MTLYQLCDRVLREGVQDASLRTRNQRREVKKRILAIESARARANTVESTALTAGVHNFGRAIHESGLNTRLAAGLCRGEQVPQPDVREQAYLYVTGLNLVREALNYLPAVPQAAGFGWSYLNPKTQLKLLREVSGVLEKSIQVPRLLNDRSKLGNHRHLGSMFEVRDSRQFLPLKFSELGIDQSPSCLGMSLKLGAFALATQGNWMWITPATTGLEVELGIKLPIYRQILSAYRKVPERSRRKVTALRKVVDECTVKEMTVYDWHHAIAIELDDKSWAVLDPYMGCTGLMNNSEEASRAYSVLVRYRHLLPGMSLQVGGGDVASSLAETLDKSTAMLLSAAHKLRIAIESDQYKTVEEFLSSPEASVLSWVLTWDHHTKMPDEVTPLTPNGLSEFWRHDYVKDFDHEGDQRLFRESAEHRKRCLRFVEDQLYIHAASDIKVISSRWGLNHQAVDCHLPATNIALAVLSNMLSLEESLTATAELVTLLLSHSNAQMLWHEAAVSCNDRELTAPQQRLMNDARSAVESLPVKQQLTGIQLARERSAL